MPMAPGFKALYMSFIFAFPARGVLRGRPHRSARCAGHFWLYGLAGPTLRFERLCPVPWCKSPEIFLDPLLLAGVSSRSFS
jgi:hypothetical protein